MRMSKTLLTIVVITLAFTALVLLESGEAAKRGRRRYKLRRMSASLRQRLRDIRGTRPNKKFRDFMASIRKKRTKYKYKSKSFNSTVYNACNGVCTCDDNQIVNCKSRKLLKVPKGIPATAVSIDLAFNQIGKISGFQFARHGSALKSLHLQGNKIDEIRTYGLTSLVGLTTLTLQFNKLETLEAATFRGLRELIALRLDFNRISVLLPYTFRRLYKLQTLDLRGNQLTSLHPDTFVTLNVGSHLRFSSIRHVTLMRNRLESLSEETVNYMDSLVHFSVNLNPWDCSCKLDWVTRYKKKIQIDQCENGDTGSSVGAGSNPYRCSAPSFASLDRMTRESERLFDGDDAIPLSPLTHQEKAELMNSLDRGLQATFEIQSPGQNTGLIFQCKSLGRPQTSLSPSSTDKAVFEGSIRVQTSCLVKKSNGLASTWMSVVNTLRPDVGMPFELRRQKTGDTSARYSPVDESDLRSFVFTKLSNDLKKDDLSITIRNETLSNTDQRALVEISTVMRKISPDNNKLNWVQITHPKRANDSISIVVEGSSALLKCQAHGKPGVQISWVLPDSTTLRHPAKHGQFSVTSQDFLEIDDVIGSTAGVYRCVAVAATAAPSDGAEYATDVASFRVFVIPKEDRNVRDVGVETVDTGDEWRVRCSVQASPHPAVAWVLPSGHVLIGAKSSGSLDVATDSAGDLIVRSANQSHVGIYRCFAVNEVGASSSAVQLRVRRNAHESSTAVPAAATTASSVEEEEEEDESRADNSTLVDHETITNVDESPPLLESLVTSPSPPATHPVTEKMSTVLSTIQEKDVTVATTVVEETTAEASDDDVIVPEIVVPKEIQTIPAEPTVPAMIEEEAEEEEVEAVAPRKMTKLTCYGERFLMLKPADFSLTTSLSSNISTSVFEYQREDLYVNIGAPFRLPCSRRISKKPSANYRWNFESTLERTGFGSPVTFIYTKSQDIHVPSSTADHSGIYTCFGENAAHAWVVSISMAHHVGPQPTATATSSLRIDHGDSLIAKCQVAGLSASWRRKGETHSIGSTLSPENCATPTGVLYLINLTASGDYQCGAFREGGGGRSVEELHVDVVTTSPRACQAKRDNQLVTAYVGQTLAIDCCVIANPNPTFEWRFPTLLQDGDARRSIQPNGSLLIQDVTFSDQGSYQCVASNSAGREKLTYSLIVEMPLLKFDETNSHEEEAPKAEEEEEEPATTPTQPTTTTTTTQEPTPPPVKTTTTQKPTTTTTTTEPTTTTTTKPTTTEATTTTLKLTTTTTEKTTTTPTTTEPTTTTLKTTTTTTTTEATTTPEPTTTTTTTEPTTTTTTPEPTPPPIKTTTTTEPTTTTTTPEPTPPPIKTTTTTEPTTTTTTPEPTPPPIKTTTTTEPTTTTTEATTTTQEPTPPPTTAKTTTTTPASNVMNVTEEGPKADTPSTKLSVLSSSASSHSTTTAQVVIIPTTTVTSVPNTTTTIAPTTTTTPTTTTKKPQVKRLVTTVYAGTNVYFHCKCKFPAIGSSYRRYEPRRNFEMKWTLPNGEQADNRSPALGGRAFAYYNGTLLVRRIQDDDQGLYVCLSKDIHGRVIQTEVVVRIYSTLPRLRQGLYQTVRGHIGRSARAECSAKGYPKPRISWRLPDGRTVSPGSSFKNLMVDRHGRLIVQHLSLENTGKYLCIAKNVRGQVERTVLIKPYYTRPRITRISRKWVGARRGQSVRLPCGASGFPKPSIRWMTPHSGYMRQNQVIRDTYGTRMALYDSGTLILNRVSSKDSGFYTCTASNLRGKTRMTIRISVY